MSEKRRPRLSKFPLDKPFERQDPQTPLSEFVLRLIIDFDSDNPIIVGTGTLICGYLVMTAKHVVEQYVISGEHSLDAIQIVSGKDYVIWSVIGGWSHPHTDISLLHLADPPRASDPTRAIEHRGLVL